MSLRSAIGRLLARRRVRPGNDPDRGLVPLYSRTIAGVPITPDRALTNAVVWACVRYLSQTVAQLPWRVMRKTPNGVREVVERHPTASVLEWRTNPELAPFAFKETMVAWALLWGNGYAEIEKDLAGRVVALWPIHPSRVDVRRDAATRELVYEVMPEDSGEKVVLSASEMFHIRGFGDGPVGLSVVAHAAQSIGWAQATELFGAAFFGNGLNPSGAIQTDKGLTPDGMKRLRAELDAAYRGPRNANRTIILDAGMKYERMSIQPDEAQFIESMQFQVETICRWFGVPPHKVAHLLRSTNNNIEHQSIEVVVDAITPWVLRLEEEADYKLFGHNRGNFYTDIDMRGLLRGDMKARADYVRAMSDLGALSPNEIRAEEGLNPIPHGDTYLVQVNRAPLDRIGEQMQSAPVPPPRESDPTAEEEEAANALYWRVIGRVLSDAA